MPIVLTDLFSAFTGGVKKIETLAEAMTRGMTVLARQRGAFLTSWFGPGLPVDGLAVQAHVVNGDAILERIQHARALQAAGRRQDLAPNLLEPLSGIGGIMSGGLLGVTLASVSLLTVGFAFEALGGLLAALFGMYRLYRWWARSDTSGHVADLARRRDNEPDLGPGYVNELDVLGRNGARLAGSLIGVANDMTADRSDVADPVMRAFLTLGDKMAAVMTRAVGAFAVMFVSFPPADVIRGLIASTKELVMTMAGVAMALISSVMALNPLPLIEVVAIRLIAVGSTAIGILDIKNFARSAVAMVRMPFLELRQGGDRMSEAAITIARDQVTSHPVYDVLRRARGLGKPLADLGRGLQRLASAILVNVTPSSLQVLLPFLNQLPRPGATGPSNPSSTPGTTPSLPARAIGQLRSVLPRPSLPTLLTPTVGRAVVEGLIAEQRPFRIVGSVARTFGAELAAQRRRGRAALADPNLQAATALVANASRLAGIDAHMERAWGYLADVQRPLGELPVRDPQPPRRIVPIIGKLRVRAAADRDAELLEDWAHQIPQQMATAPVPIPVEAA